MRMTLRQKFLVGFVTLCAVIVSSGLGVRLLGKAALFHHLERDHLGVVMQASNDLKTVLEGGKSAGTVSKATLAGHLRTAKALAQRADSELFAVEQAAFQLIGFGDILRLPREDIAVATRIETRLAADGGTMLTPALAAEVAPDIDHMHRLSDRFGPLVAEATAFIRWAALALTFAPLACLMIVFHMVRSATLVPIGRVAEAADRIAQGDLTGPGLPHTEDEVGRLAQSMDTMRTNLSLLVAQVRDRSAEVDLALQEVSQGSGDLSARTERQAATLQRTASGVTDLSHALRSDAGRVGEAESVAGQARDLAVTGGDAAQRAIDRMNEILASSRRIAASRR